MSPRLQLRPKAATRPGRGAAVQLPGTGHSDLPQKGWLPNVSDADEAVIALLAQSATFRKIEHWEQRNAYKR